MKKIVSVLLILVMIFSISGCTKNNPEDTVKSYLDAIKSGNLEKLDEYIKDDDNDSDLELSDFNNEDEFDKAFLNAFSKLEYEILDTKVDGDKAQVKTKIKAPNLGDVMGDIMAEILPGAFEEAFEEIFSENPEKTFDEDAFEKQMEELFIKKISKDDISMVENTVKINLVKKDKKWLIEPNTEFINALSGNLENILNRLDDIE